MLSALGVDHKPLPCAVWAANAAGLALADAKVPVEEWPEEAFSIGVDPDYTPPGPTRLDQWWGHLCIAGSDWLMDLTAQQFHRPQRGVIVEGGLLVTDLPVDLTKDNTQMLEADLRGGGTIRYISRNELARWRMSSAWRQDVAPQIIDMVCSSVIDKLRERADG